MKMLAAALLALSAPTFAQPAASASKAVVDPQRLTLAERTVDAIWPIGTYQRMTSGTMDSMMDSLMGSMFDLKVGDMLAGTPTPDGKPVDPTMADATVRELSRKVDPHFEERMRITNRVMMAEMTPVMTAIEPDLRAALARVYARRFDAAQLEDMNRFFATPSGKAYAGESMMMMVDPEIMAMFGQATPRMMSAMPGIMEKVKAATAHLPRPAPRDGDGGKADDETTPTS